MSQALASHFAHDSLLPRAPGGMGAGAVLALLAHAVLLLALTSTVQWRTSPPEVFNAELWAAMPRAAAPLPAAPPPVPTPAPPPAAPPPEPRPDAAAKPAPPPPAPPARDADIATEQARKLEAQRKLQAAEAEKAQATTKADAERKALEAERAKVKAQAKADADADAKLKKEAEAARKRETETAKAAADKLKRDEADRSAAAEAKADDERLAKQRAENLRRMMGQATGPTGATTGTGGTGSAAQSGAPSASYVGRLIALIKPNIVFTGQVEGNPSAEVEVRAAAGGSIISKRLVKSSGNKEWDEAVLRAIDRTAALPRDNDGSVPPALTLVFRPGG